jgi:hypothetical protein
MLRVLGNVKQCCDGISRRTFLHAGGLGALSLALPGLAAPAEAKSPRSVRGNLPGLGKAKSVIVLYLYGAPSQMDTFDPKPSAPPETRGEFKTVATRISGVRLCEHLPRIAGMLDRVALVRSMTHPYPTHGVAYALSGIPVNPERDVSGHWPFYGSVLDYLWARRPADRQPAGVPRNLCLPWPLHSHSGNKSHRGLHAAWLGKQWETIFAEFAGQASRAEGAPSADGARAVRSKFDPFDGITPESTFRFTVPTIMSQAPADGILHDIGRSGLELPPEITLDRLDRRRSLLKQFDDSRRALDRSAGGFERFQRTALEMITSPRCSRALDVAREPLPMREKYGLTLFGQGALATRRLVEAGVRVVTVYWDEFGPANTAWDTHVNNFPRLKEGLCPTLDQVVPTLLDDLEQRGLLDQTLVMLLTEHGRTPRLSKVPGGGREHWSYAYSILLAGAGIRRGTVIGATDRQGGYPIDRPLNPKDVLATAYHLLGFDPQTISIPNREGRPIALLPYGEVIPELLA